MIHGNALVLHIGRGGMATHATSKRFSNGPVLKVAEVARGRRNRQMLPLDDLGMTGGATQVLPPTELAQVLLVIETNS